MKSRSESRSRRHLEKLADLALALESSFSALAVEDLPTATATLRDRFNAGETLDELLPEAFALARHAVLLITGKQLYRVQLMGAAALHAGMVAEMKTGEGKTLTAVPVSFLNALAGRGVHVVTVNDYLARRDAEEMGRIHAALGLTVAAVYSGAPADQCRDAYHCDITYGTASQFGFDYMRDNMVNDPALRMQRDDAFFALIDEVDSVLVDEARTPMIISGPAPLSSQRFIDIAAVAAALTPQLDYEVDLEFETVALTESGFHAAEKLLGVDDLSDGHIIDLWLLQNAISARELFIAGRDYVVDSGRVKLVDQATGRILDSHSWQDGQHQAVEAKEGVEITPMTAAWGRITYPGFFTRYEKLSGMTGTAVDASEVFEAVYEMSVVQIPPNVPSRRVDHDDMIFASSAERDQALVERVRAASAAGQPVLVGTTSVNASETVSALLTRAGVAHQVLNAVNHAREAEIVAQAGRIGAVTVATSMAGRGTDILLGGDAEKLAAHDDSLSVEQWRDLCKAEAWRVRRAGGLLVVGRERHESRRVDDQLIGRSGRQGDVGESQFFLSLEDPLVEVYGDGAASKMLAFASSSGPIRAKSVSRLVERAQEHLSNLNDQQRATTLRYDLLYNAQRRDFYRRRAVVLTGVVSDHGDDEVELSAASAMLDTAIEELVERELAVHIDLADRPEPALVLEHITAKTGAELAADLVSRDSEASFAPLVAAVRDHYEALRSLNTQAFDDVCRLVALRALDIEWRSHLLELDALQDAIGLRQISGTDPMTGWIKDADSLYQDMWVSARKTVLLTMATFKRQEEPAATDTAAEPEDAGNLPDSDAVPLAQQGDDEMPL